jgi:pyruvate formate-lyase activating enzyme-like uncharacterized protein
MAWSGDFTGSFYNYLPRGCEICRVGAGLVLFVTGKCNRCCFYCPLSKERKDKNVVFADEQPVECVEDILKEAAAISALGTGITGGEPLLELDSVLRYIRALKHDFGPSHHIHLYTGLLPGRDVLMRLREAGLDEIRFHPPKSEWSNPAGLRETLKEAQSLGMEAGVEIPAIEAAPEVIKAVKDADAFLNINELEFSETNAESLKALGFTPQEMSCGARESEGIAREHFMHDDLKVHYCPSRFKDAVQLRERLKRRCGNVARPFDQPTDDGTLIHGTICGDLNEAVRMLKTMDVPDDMYLLRHDRIDIAAPILEDISKELKSIGCIVSLIERYPLEDGLVVERIPL